MKMVFQKITLEHHLTTRKLTIHTVTIADHLSELKTKTGKPFSEF